MDSIKDSTSSINIYSLMLYIVLSLVPLIDAGFDNDIVNYMIMISLLTQLIYSYKTKQNFTINNNSTFFLTIFLLWAGISIIWSVNYVRSLIEFLQLLLYVIVFYMTYQLDDENSRKVIDIVLLIGSGISLLGILEYIFVNTGRIVSTFTNPNPFGTYLIMLLLFTWGIAIRNNKLILKIVSFIMLLALLLTGSRGAFISGFIACPFLFIGLRGKELRLSIKNSIFLFMLGLIAVRGLMFIAPIIQENLGVDINILNSLIRPGTLVGSSLIGRLEFWKAAIKVFLSKPLNGYGIGTFFTTYFIGYDGNRWYSRFVHNHYIQIVAELGIIGLIIFLLFIIFIFKNIYSQYKAGNYNIILPGATAAIVGFLIHIGMDFSWNFPGVTVIFFWILGMAIGKYEEPVLFIKQKYFNYKILNIVLSFLLLVSIWHITFSNLYSKGIEYAKEHNIEESNKVLQFANKLYPINAVGYMLESDNYIHMYHETNDIDYLNKGISLMEHSITLAPFDVDLHNHLGSLYLLSGNLEKAEEHLEIAAKYNIYSVNIFIDLANFYTSQNRYDEAEKILLLADSRKEHSIKAATREEKESRVFEASLVNSYLYLLYRDIGDNENMKIQVEELYSMAEEYSFLKEYYKLENFIY